MTRLRIWFWMIAEKALRWLSFWIGVGETKAWLRKCRAANGAAR